MKNLLLFVLLVFHPLTSMAEPEQGVYEHRGERFPYSVRSSGDNYNFEFSRNPGGETERLRAARDIFQKVYGEDTLPPKYSDFFMKETARCFAFDATFYTYRVCMFPNDYAPDKKDRFWGFVNRLPNLWWFVTRQLVPLILVIAALFFLLRAKRSPAMTG